MTMIEAVKQFVAAYPGLQGGKLNVDFLPAEAANYSVDAVPAPTVVKPYLNGDSVRQFLFVLASRTYYGPHIRQQLDNLCFFEKFAEWLDQKNSAREFPVLGEGRTVQKMGVVTSGYAFAPDTETARYQIQCKITYFQKGGRNQ